jgi:hypothetical protein
MHRWGPFDDENDATQGVRRTMRAAKGATRRATSASQRLHPLTRLLSRIAALLRALEAEALPPALCARLAAGEPGAAGARMRYIHRHRDEYIARMASAAARRFAPWAPQPSAAAALRQIAEAEAQHASLRRLAATGPSSEALKELIRTADDSLEEALEQASWRLLGHADEAAPPAKLVAGVSLALARAATPQRRGRAPSTQRDTLPDALPASFPEVRRDAHKRIAHGCC